MLPDRPIRRPSPRCRRSARRHCCRGVGVGRGAGRRTGRSGVAGRSAVVRTEAAGQGGKGGVDGGSVGGGHLPGDVADPVRALHDGDTAFGQRFAVPLLERQRLQLHHQAQQPDPELLGAAGLGRIHHQLIDRDQGVRFGHPAGHPVNDPHLLDVKCTRPVGQPHGGQADHQPAGPGDQTPHRIRLLPQQHRHLLSHELPRPHPPRAAASDSDGVPISLDPNVGVLDAGRRQLRLSGRRRPPRRHHLMAGRLQLPEFDHA